MRLVSLMISLVWAFGASASSAVAATLTVPTPYATIQAAIDASSDGDTIVVAQGTYAEHNINFHSKKITLRSTDPTNPGVVAATIIDGSKSGSVVTFNSGEDNDSVVQGLTIANGSAGDGGGVYCADGCRPTIVGNVITRNSAAFGGGIYCRQDNYDPEMHTPVIANNTITRNRASSMGGGIYCYGDGYGPWIHDNAIRDNFAGMGGGIACVFGRPNITKNAISGNRASRWSGGGIYCYNNGDPDIEENTITGNRADVGAGIACELVSGADIYKNKITDNKGDGIGCEHGSGSRIVGNTIARNDGIGVVGDSDSRPYVSGNAISANTDGGVLCADQSSVCDNTIHANTGWVGGVRCDGGSPTVQRNTITENGTADGQAGGIACYGDSSRIENNIVSGNEAAGGGGIYCDHSSATLRNNTVVGNSGAGGGGVRCTDTCSLTIVNCIIAFSSAGAGVAVDPGSSIVAVCNDCYGNAGGDYTGLPTPPTGTNGNISADPLFADLAKGDLHLKSCNGRRYRAGWVEDSVTSPCIDAGDPNSPFADEPRPNGGRVNQGNYGNTDGASRSSMMASHTPLLNATGVPTSTGVTIVFPWPVLTTTAEKCFALSPRGGTSVKGAFTWSAHSKQMAFQPTSPLQPGVAYAVLLTAGVKPKGGATVSWRESFAFTTGSSGSQAVTVTTTAVALASGAQVTFTLSAPAAVQARALNLAGRPIRSICQDRACEAGTNTLLWNARSDAGLAVPNGNYLIEVIARGDDGSQSRALTTVRISR